MSASCLPPFSSDISIGWKEEWRACVIEGIIFARIPFPQGAIRYLAENIHNSIYGDLFSERQNIVVLGCEEILASRTIKSYKLGAKILIVYIFWYYQ